MHVCIDESKATVLCVDGECDERSGFRVECVRALVKGVVLHLNRESSLCYNGKFYCGGGATGIRNSFRRSVDMFGIRHTPFI